MHHLVQSVCLSRDKKFKPSKPSLFATAEKSKGRLDLPTQIFSESNVLAESWQKDELMVKIIC